MQALRRFGRWAGLRLAGPFGCERCGVVGPYTVVDWRDGIRGWFCAPCEVLERAEWDEAERIEWGVVDETDHGIGGPVMPGEDR